MKKVRVRFAPSPTGQLHVGGLRTALFNYLFAKTQGGDFILRIEDTDQERYVEGAEQGIIDMLAWASINPDEGPHLEGAYGPYRQSERLEKYREAVEKLISDGRAYKCYTTSEELDEMRKKQMARGVPPKYDGRHRDLTPEQQKRLEDEGRKHVVRMKIPEKDERIVVKDIVRGSVAFNSSQVDDQVLLKSDGFPTYHLAVVVDDNHMGITHILRAEEWLPSTPKHLYLYKWLGFDLPEFAHLPLLLNEDRSKMSKRKGDVAVEDYAKKGYLPEAFVNFISLLGWSPGNDQEIMTSQELVEKFSLDRVGKSASVFDREKLNWMNQSYLKDLPLDEAYVRLRPFIDQTPYAQSDENLLKKIIKAVQPALVIFSDIGAHMPIFFRKDDDPVSPEIINLLTQADSKTVLAALLTQLEGLTDLSADDFKAATKAVQKSTSIKGKGLFAPLRQAITLETEGPDLSLISEIFGVEKINIRIKNALNF